DAPAPARQADRRRQHPQTGRPGRRRQLGQRQQVVLGLIRGETEDAARTSLPLPGPDHARLGDAVRRHRALAGRPGPEPDDDRTAAGGAHDARRRLHRRHRRRHRPPAAAAPARLPPRPPPTPPIPIILGSPTVFINHFPAARWIPSLDTGGCAVFLGNPALAATRTTLIGDGGGGGVTPRPITMVNIN